jgi:hypothetical protein
VRAPAPRGQPPPAGVSKTTARPVQGGICGSWIAMPARSSSADSSERLHGLVQPAVLAEHNRLHRDGQLTHGALVSMP